MDFEQEFDCCLENFFSIIKNYENLPKYLPRQLQSIEVLKKENNKTIIKCTIMFKTLVKKEISQNIEINEQNNILEIKVLDGHAKDTEINLSIKNSLEKITVNVKVDLKLSLKAKILSPIIKREYKSLLRGVFAKMAIDGKKMSEN